MIFDRPYDWLTAIVAAPFIGSFLSVLVVRLPHHADVVLSRSHCVRCAHALGPTDLVPLVSFATTRGQCRHCGARISALYPLIEVGAIIVAAWAATTASGPLLWITCALGWSLLALAVMDAREMILSDAITLPLIAAGLIVAFFLDRERILAHVIGAAAGFVLMLGVIAAYARFRGGDGLGRGDAKLLAAAGAWGSWTSLGGVLMIGVAATLLGAVALIVTGRTLDAKTALPLGPGLAIGLWLSWLYGPVVLT